VKAALKVIARAIAASENQRLVRAELAKMPEGAERPSAAKLAEMIPELSEEQVAAALKAIDGQENGRPPTKDNALTKADQGRLMEAFPDDDSASKKMVAPPSLRTAGVEKSTQVRCWRRQPLRR
jgi:hypothetical protein